MGGGASTTSTRKCEGSACCDEWWVGGGKLVTTIRGAAWRAAKAAMASVVCRVAIWCAVSSMGASYIPIIF